MRITFIMPGYPSGPSGGYKVVYEYASRLVSRGHEVTVIHPRCLKYAFPPKHLTLRNRVRRMQTWMSELVSRPLTDWHQTDKRVSLKFVDSLSARFIPSGDAVVATSWKTVNSVLRCPPTGGHKFYLIQGYETWDGHKDLVDATWRSNLHKIVVSKWLLDLGNKLGAHDVTYIPNAVDERVYQITKPLEERPLQVAMTFSAMSIKGATDGIRALTIAREHFPDLKVVLFGKDRRQPYVPEWIEFHRAPAQRFIVDEIYNNSRLFLSSSWSEGFALPPAEAASCGCAIVATDSGGIRDYIENGVSGLLSPMQNPDMLAHNLCLLLSNESLLQKLAKAGHQSVRKLSWERSTDRLEALIGSIANRQPRASLIH